MVMDEIEEDVVMVSVAFVAFRAFGWNQDTSIASADVTYILDDEVMEKMADSGLG